MRGVEAYVCEGCGGVRGEWSHVGVWRQMCVRGVWRCMCVRRVWTASLRDTGEDSVNTYCLCLYV